MIAINKWWTRLNFVKQVWVIADLLELHENVQELNAVLATHAVDSFDVAGDDSLVELLLELCEAQK